MKKLISKVFSEKNIDFYILLLFCGTFLSIPLFSFVGKLYFITWILTILLIGFMYLSFLLYKPIKISFITLSLFLFCFFAIFSSLLTGFKSFLSTPLLNTLVIIILYTYYVSLNAHARAKTFSGLYLALLIFGAIFAGLYLYERFILKTATSGSRFGNAFGDENDISILLAFGFAFSLYYLFKTKKWYFKVLNVGTSVLFIALSFLCGSKIALLIVLIISFVIIGLHFGKRKWYLTLIIMVSIVSGIVFALQLSMFSALKDRFLNMLYTFVGKQYKNLNPDSSTAGRLEMIINGFSLFLRRPLFGFGLNGYHVYSTHHSGWSHNHWSDTFCNYGIVGTFFYHLPFVLFFRKTISKKRFSFVGLVFFLVATLSIALFKEKMFAYSAGLFLADTDISPIFEFNILKRKGGAKEKVKLSKIELVEIIPSLNPIGGAETMFVNLCEEIKLHHKNEINLNVIVLYNDRQNILYDRLTSLGIKVHYLGKHKGIDFHCAVKLANILSIIKPNLIHSHLGTTITLMLALRFKKKYPIVHTFHHMVGTGFKKEIFNRFLIKHKFIYPVAVSELSGESIKQKTHIHCDYIDNGINLDKFNSSIPMANRDIDFLCVASFRPVKNQKYLIETYKEIVKCNYNFKLVFLGDGPLKDLCINEAGDLCNKSIYFMGAVDNVSEYMSKSKILVLTSTSEGNPMVVNEALASGMYVIANEVGGIPNLIKNGITGDLINPNDSNHLKEHMIKRAQDVSFLEQRRVENQKQLEKYSIQHSVIQYIDLFKKLILDDF